MLSLCSACVRPYIGKYYSRFPQLSTSHLQATGNLHNCGQKAGALKTKSRNHRKPCYRPKLQARRTDDKGG